MFRSSVLGLTMLPGQCLTSEIREHLAGRTLLAPSPLLDGEQDVVVKAQCCAHAHDAKARVGSSG